MPSNPKQTKETNMQVDAQLTAKNEEIAHLKKRIQELSNSSLESTSLEDRIWEVVLSSSIQSLFNRNIPIDNDSEKVAMHLRKALHIADIAIETARSYRETKDQIQSDREAVKENDILSSLVKTTKV